MSASIHPQTKALLRALENLYGPSWAAGRDQQASLELLDAHMRRHYRHPGRVNVVLKQLHPHQPPPSAEELALMVDKVAPSGGPDEACFSPLSTHQAPQSEAKEASSSAQKSQSAHDPKAWARRILDLQAKGATVSATAVAMARQALP